MPVPGSAPAVLRGVVASVERDVVSGCQVDLGFMRVLVTDGLSSTHCRWLLAVDGFALSMVYGVVSSSL